MLKMVTPERNISDFLQKAAKIVEDCIVEEFTEWAKADDAYLRANRGFNDQTGNLRSSLGAIVAKDGRMVFSTPFSTVLGGTKGSAEGRKMAQQLAAETQGVIAKIMLAGMDYAQYVEDIDSKDVLESRRIQCEREAKGVFDRAMQKAERRIAQL